MAKTPHSAETPTSGSGVAEVSLNGETYSERRVLAWREWARVGMLLDQALANSIKGAPSIYSLLFKNSGDTPGVLLMARASEKNRLVVAWHRGPTAAEALRSFVSRLGAGSVAWRDDKPYREGSNGQDEGQVGLPPCEL